MLKRLTAIPFDTSPPAGPTRVGYQRGDRQMF
jgi:hypothetical protein